MGGAEERTLKARSQALFVFYTTKTQNAMRRFHRPLFNHFSNIERIVLKSLSLKWPLLQCHTLLLGLELPKPHQVALAVLLVEPWFV